MRRNIKLAYVLAYCFNSLFWIGIWALFYLQFIDYAGIGIIEAIWIFTAFVMEVPTGAIADLLGKKITLFMAFFIMGIGQIFMGYSVALAGLVTSAVIINNSQVLHSGAFEALIYDSLKQLREEERYDSVLANVQTIGLIASAIASIIGGFMYASLPKLPYLALGGTFLIGAIVTLFLKEPAIDSEKFSLPNYLNQTKQGFRQLFKSSFRGQAIRLLTFGFFLVILYEILGDLLVIEFGFQEKQLGIYYAIMFLIAAGGAQLAPWFKKKFGMMSSLTIIGVIYSLTLLVSPQLGLVLGGLSVYVRASLRQVIKNITSSAINRHTESKYRATTISTFNMLETIPYMLLAYFIGAFMDIVTAKVFAFYFGLTLGIVVVGQHFLYRKNPDTNE